MSSYVRPRIAAPVFHDADGEVLEYGRRWDGSPPEDTYSVDTHPERFAPLHTIADALIAHLREEYDVEIVEDEEVAADLLHPAPTVARAVRIQPNDAACAALTIVYTQYPGIFVHAGLLHDFPYPVCGCDACDSTWVSEADELEQLVLAVVSGHYRERIALGSIEHTLVHPGGESSGRSRAQDFPPERVAAAAPILDGLAEGWAAWPCRGC